MKSAKVEPSAMSRLRSAVWSRLDLSPVSSSYASQWKNPYSFRKLLLGMVDASADRTCMFLASVIFRVSAHEVQTSKLPAVSCVTRHSYDELVDGSVN